MLLSEAYKGNLHSFKDVVALLDRGEGCLEASMSAVRDETDGFGVIHMAAGGGSLPLLKYLVEDLHLKVDTLDGLGQTPLTYAARDGRTSVVSYLVEHGASPNQVCHGGFTPLHFSVSGGHLEATEILLSNGIVDVNQLSIKGTALHIAAYAGNDSAVKLLLDHGADLERKIDDFTPLALALLAPSPKCVKLLMKAGADTNGLRPVSPEIQSANNGLSDFMRRLLEARADLDILYDEDGPEEALMIPLPVCSNVLCHRLARLAVGCCGRSYCCVQHLLESPHPRNHAVGLPTLLVRSDLSLDAVVPGCVRPACPPWWLRKAFCTSDQIVYEFLSSDDRVGGQMVHSYEAGQNEPVVEF